MNESLTVELEENEDIRLDSYLAEKFPEYSRSSWKKIIESDSVKLNNSICKPRVKLNNGDKIVINYSPTTKSIKNKIEILHEDENILVINKPSGVIVHPKNQTDVDESIIEYFSDRLSSVKRNGIIHRLDRYTSGVLVLAKNDKAIDYYKNLFAQRKLKKWYLAALEEPLKEERYELDLPIEPNPKKRFMFRVGESGKDAISSVYKIGNNALINPKTGRTHQIRVHLAYLNSIILNDSLYGSKSKNPRYMLHAYQMHLADQNNKKQTFIAPLPQDMKQYINDEELKQAGDIIKQS